MGKGKLSCSGKNKGVGSTQEGSSRSKVCNVCNRLSDKIISHGNIVPTRCCTACYNQLRRRGSFERPYIDRRMNDDRLCSACRDESRDSCISIGSDTRAGTIDWRPLHGCKLCRACYYKILRNGTENVKDNYRVCNVRPGECKKEGNIKWVNIPGLDNVKGCASCYNYFYRRKKKTEVKDGEDEK